MLTCTIVWTRWKRGKTWSSWIPAVFTDTAKATEYEQAYTAKGWQVRTEIAILNPDAPSRS